MRRLSSIAKSVYWICGMLASLVLMWPMLLGAAGPQPVTAGAPDFPGILRAHANTLASVTTNAEALAFFASHLAGALSLQESVAALAGKPPIGKTSADRVTNPELTASAIRLTAELAAWRLATAIKEAADATAAPALQTVLQQASTQQSWLLQEGVGRQHLRVGKGVRNLFVKERAGSEGTLSPHGCRK